MIDFNEYGPQLDEDSCEMLLNGFDIDLVGLECAKEIEHDQPWVCPFTPGCGGVPGPECPLTKRAMMISIESVRRQ